MAGTTNFSTAFTTLRTAAAPVFTAVKDTFVTSTPIADDHPKKSAIQSLDAARNVAGVVGALAFVRLLSITAGAACTYGVVMGAAYEAATISQNVQKIHQNADETAAAKGDTSELIKLMTRGTPASRILLKLAVSLTRIDLKAWVFSELVKKGE